MFHIAVEVERCDDTKDEVGVGIRLIEGVLAFHVLVSRFREAVHPDNDNSRLNHIARMIAAPAVIGEQGIHFEGVARVGDDFVAKQQKAGAFIEQYRIIRIVG